MDWCPRKLVGDVLWNMLVWSFSTLTLCGSLSVRIHSVRSSQETQGDLPIVITYVGK